MKPLLETRTNQHPGHMRFSGEPGIAFTVRITVDASDKPDQRVQLEFEQIIFDDDTGHTLVYTSFHPTLEEALEHLVWDPKVSNQVYNLVMDDVEKLQRQ